MITVTVEEAEADFGQVLGRVLHGEEVLISSKGQPVARLTAVTQPPRRRTPGSARGQVIMHGDFDAPLPNDVLESFEQ